LKEKVLADAGCGILQSLGHESDAADAGEKEDAVAEVLALQQEIDGENDDDAEGPDGAEEAHKELGGGLELGAIGVHDAHGLGLRQWILDAWSRVAGAGSEIRADVLNRGESLFEGLPGGRVDGSYFLLDAETISGKIAGDVEELAGDDVSDSADDGEGEHAGDDNGEYARDVPVLKAADGRGQ